MRNIIILVIVTALGGCVASMPNRQTLVPKTSYSQIGATLYSPDEPGWVLAQSNDFGLAFFKRYGSSQNSAVAVTSIFKVEGFESDSAFLTHIAEQKHKGDDKTRFKILNVNNKLVSFKNTSCLKYRTLTEDHKNKGINSSDFQYLKLAGYICRHPANKDTAFRMEISHRSSEKDFPKRLLAVGEDFFSNIQFINKGLK